jgi:hypothetical protein
MVRSLRRNGNIFLSFTHLLHRHYVFHCAIYTRLSIANVNIIVFVIADCCTVRSICMVVGDYKSARWTGMISTLSRHLDWAAVTREKLATSCWFRRSLFDYDGVRLCLRTAATSGFIVHPPGDIWARRAMVVMIPAGDTSWLVHQSFLAVLPAETSATSRTNVRRSENFAYLYLKYLTGSLTCRKILRHGTFPLYFPSERKVCCRFASTLKIHRLGRVWTRDNWVQWQAH